jgi:hypothetical protein
LNAWCGGTSKAGEKDTEPVPEMCAQLAKAAIEENLMVRLITNLGALDFEVCMLLCGLLCLDEGASGA